MFCSFVRDLVVAMEVEVVAVTVEVAVVVDLVEVVVVEAAAVWRWALASNSRFSSSRSFCISFCWISERLKTRFLPVS